MADHLAIFDFDKTLIRADSFQVFARLGARCARERAILAGFALAGGLRALSNAQVKERVLRRVWVPLAAPARAVLLQRLFLALDKLIRPTVMQRLDEHLERGHRVAVVSASPSLYMAPYLARRSAAIELRCTQVGDDGAVLDNVRGPRKQEVARELIGATSPRISAYGDHITDLDVLALADRITLVAPDRALAAALARQGRTYEVIAA